MSLGMGSYCNSPISEEIKVGNYTSIAEDCYFHAKGDNHLVAVNKKCVYTTNWNQPEKENHIEIGNDVWICRGVKILPGIKVGTGAIIGAYSVVTKDVPPFAFVAGNPARIKRYRFSKAKIKKLLKIQWWNWKDEKVRRAFKSGYMTDIDLFLIMYSKV